MEWVFFEAVSGCEVQSQNFGIEGRNFGTVIDNP